MKLPRYRTVILPRNYGGLFLFLREKEVGRYAENSNSSSFSRGGEGRNLIAGLLGTGQHKKKNRRQGKKTVMQ